MATYNIILNGANSGAGVVPLYYNNSNADTINFLVGPGISGAYTIYVVYGDVDDVINVVYAPGVVASQVSQSTVYFYTTQPDIGVALAGGSFGTIAQVCFTAGTQVQTPGGPVRIEDLAEGDLVLTRDNGAQPLRWIGQSRVTTETLRAHPHLRPIRISAGALGDNARTMVSPAHRMLVTGWRAEALAGEAEVLAPAKSLINDRTITVAHDVDEVVYFHLMFDAHELILADGAWSESFHPATQSLSPATAAEVIALFPEVEQAASSTRLGRAVAAAETVAVLSL